MENCGAGLHYAVAQSAYLCGGSTNSHRFAPYRRSRWRQLQCNISVGFLWSCPICPNGSCGGDRNFRVFPEIFWFGSSKLAWFGQAFTSGLKGAAHSQTSFDLAINPYHPGQYVLCHVGLSYFLGLLFSIIPPLNQDQKRGRCLPPSSISSLRLVEKQLRLRDFSSQSLRPCRHPLGHFPSAQAYQK